MFAFVFFCFKQKTAYELRISDWSSDGCSSVLVVHGPLLATLLCDFACSLRPGQSLQGFAFRGRRPVTDGRPFRLRAKALSDAALGLWIADADDALAMTAEARSEEHTSELQSLMRISDAVFCLKKKKSMIQLQLVTV